MQSYNLTFQASAVFGKVGFFSVIDQFSIQTTDPVAGVSTIVSLSGTRTLNDNRVAQPASEVISGLAPTGTMGSDNQFFPFSDILLNMPLITTSGFDFYVETVDSAENPSSILLKYDAASGAYTETVPGETEGKLFLTPVCFASGTRLLVRRGTATCHAAVEDLQVGDLAVTASGTARPIIWIGHRTVECASHPRANEVLPVRIAAHAFAADRPVRDLVVSPGHSIAVDLLGEVLIPASALINGTTIRQEIVERVTYWHVELESHDLLVAENLATESYLDMGNRGFLPRPGQAIALHAVPDAAPATHADFCRPFHAAGSTVDFVRERLMARATQLDWVQVDNPLADLHLVVDGRRVEADVQGLSARFLVPATAQTVWLGSDTVVPAMAGGGADMRTLGVCIGKLVIDDGFGSQLVSADDARLSVGFHHVEEGPQRWTAGRARLPASLWAGCRGDFFLRVDLARPALPRWKRTITEAALKVARLGMIRTQ